MQNDLISRSALIEHIKEFTNINEGYFENPQLLSRVIESQPTAYIKDNYGWIPVSERYPENDRYVLLSFENFIIPTVGRYEEDEEGGAFFVGDDDIS